MLNVCNQISWRIIANNKIVEAKEGSWITDEYYSESIRNVIGKAIADCLTEKNEFAGKKAGDVITFDVDAKTYTAENWNAVVLWNLIHVYYCGYKKDKAYTIEQAFEQVEENVKNTYSTKIKGFDEILEKAMGDIREYAKELNLQKEFYEFCNTYYVWLKKCRKDRTIADGIWIKLTPVLSMTCYDETKDAILWLFEYKYAHEKKKLELGEWANRSTIKLKMQGIFYNIPWYAIIMESVCSPYQIKMKTDRYLKESTTVLIKENNYTPEDKDIVTIYNYIITGKKPADVESIYYDRKDGWKVKYKE